MQKQQETTAIILSLGRLQKEVNTDPFIGYMLHVAKAVNSQFEFTQDMQIKAFQLSEQFNTGLLDVEPAENEKIFRIKLLELLHIPQDRLSEREFWQRWNEMVVIGDIQAEISNLQAFAAQHKVVFYLHSDTNSQHVQKMQREFPTNTLQIDGNQAKLGPFPLYLSCLRHTNRLKLIELVDTDISAKALNKPGRIVLIYGDPNNIQNPLHRANAQRELANLQKLPMLTRENPIVLVMDNKALSLQDTLAKCVVLPRSPGQEAVAVPPPGPTQ